MPKKRLDAALGSEASVRSVYPLFPSHPELLLEKSQLYGQ